MKTALAAAAILFLALNLGAQSTRIQIAKAQPDTQLNPSAGSGGGGVRSDLNVCLDDLQRVSAATGSDIANIEIDKWKSGWRTAWLKNSSHKQQAAQTAASLQHNLVDAMPGLIAEVQNSHGSVSSTFKLYNDLNVVVETLDSLVESVRTYGKKGESGPIAADAQAMGHLREELSSYIQQTAASLEPRTKLPNSSPSSTPKKVVVDDNVPSKPAKKKSASFRQ